MKLGDQIEIERFVRKEVEMSRALFAEELRSPFMTRGEVADYFRVDEGTVRRNRGFFKRIRRVKDEGKYFYLREDVERERDALIQKMSCPADMPGD